MYNRHQREDYVDYKPVKTTMDYLKDCVYNYFAYTPFIILGCHFLFLENDVASLRFSILTFVRFYLFPLVVCLLYIVFRSNKRIELLEKFSKVICFSSKSMTGEVNKNLNNPSDKTISGKNNKKTLYE